MPVPYIPERRPTLADYLRGLPEIERSLTALQRRLFEEQYRSDGHRCFALDLATRCGTRGHGVVNRQYALAAQKFCRATGCEPQTEADGRPMWWTIWSSGWRHARGRYEWQMHPEFAEALEQLGWVTPQVDRPDRLAEEVPPDRVYDEGAVRRITINAYERDPVARDACIAKHGCVCSACGFDFAQTYGPIGEGFIHVHHLRPLGDGSGSRAVDAKRDLRPVCPNCHAMLHRREPPLSIEQLQDEIDRQRRSRGSDP